MLNQFFLQKLEAGCDEAGRGCLAGPVFAAAVMLNPDFNNEWVKDSKQISEKKRKELRPVIEQSALAWSVAMVDPIKIDEINVLNASILAMHLALDGLSISPEHIIVDGNRFKNYKDIPHTCIIKGDAKFKNIAAASILAKTYRDEFMEKIHEEFPIYNWRKNKGYPTAEHRKGIEMSGASRYHRMTFRLLPAQYELEFKN